MLIWHGLPAHSTELISLDQDLADDREVPKLETIRMYEKTTTKPFEKEDIEQFSPELDTSKVDNIFSYHADFIVEKGLSCFENIDFKQEAVLNSMNRKTKYSKTEDPDLFQGKRSIVISSISFFNTIEVKKFEQSAKPALRVEQQLHSYNRFVEASRFTIHFYAHNETQTWVELYGTTSLRSSVPKWLQRKIGGGSADKLLHFKQALEQLCETRDA